jgi:predicted metal-dependent enzyme (double-stranded beta helix superfamily)
MAYDLDQFIADCRSNLDRDPGPTGREQVRTNLEKLLGNADFLKKYCGDDQPKGVKILYEDPKLGFQVLAHINDKAHKSPPHDHGASWAIYGQATQYTDMTEWAREDDGSNPKQAKLKVKTKYRLTPGHAGIYQDGDIHSIDYPDAARFVRVTGTDLEKINRIKVDLNTGAVEQIQARAAS